MILLLALTACTPDASVSVVADPSLPSVAVVTWTSAEAGHAAVRLERDGQAILTTPDSDDSGTEHTVRVAGLRHGQEHTLVPLLTLGDGSVSEADPVTWRAPSAPADLPLFDVSVDSGDLAPGYVALHTPDRDREAVVVVDRAGEVVWYQFVEEGLAVLSVSLSHDGRALWFVTHATDYIETGATVHHVALDGSYHHRWDRDLTHSGVAELPGGGFGTLRKASEPYLDGTLLWDEIWEQDADGAESLVFSFRDAFEPERFCGHYDVLIEVDEALSLFFDWTHANSLTPSDDGLAWILLVRHYDAVLRIDRATGAVDWILGGPYSNMAVEPSEAPQDHGHMSWFRDGELLMFDNGNHRQPSASRLVGYAIDEDARTATRTLAWDDGEGTYSEWLGDVIALPHGTVLSSWTTAGKVLETTRDGDLIWELDAEAYTGTGRLVWLEGFYGPGM